MSAPTTKKCCVIHCANGRRIVFALTTRPYPAGIHENQASNSEGRDVKVHYYGEPSRSLVKAAFYLKNKFLFLKYPIGIVLIMFWIVLLPPAYLIIKLSSIAHAVAEWCGFDSRNWE